MPGLFVALWSTGFIGAKLGSPYADPFTFLLIRYVIVIALMVPVALAMRAPWPNRRDAGHAMVAGSLIHGIYLGSVFWAITEGMPAGVAALIVGLQPLLTGILAGAFLGERITALHWTGLALGLAGVGLVVSPGLDFGGGINPLTIGATLLGTLAIAIGSIYQKRFATGLDLRTANIWQYIGAMAVSLPIVLLFEDRRVEWTGEFIFALGWLVLVLSLGAVSLLMVLIRHGEVSRVAGLFYLVPASTAVIAYFLFGETLNVVQLIGMAVCMIGVMLVTRRSAPL